jgi:glutathione S-transferase
MSLTFYYAPYSTASVTDAVIAELGVAFERITLNISKGETRTPAYLKINPNGTVPTLIHDGLILWESAAITMYLGEAFGVDAGLYPASIQQRGEAMKWIVWGNVRLAEAAGRLSAALPPDQAGAVEVEVPVEQQTLAASATAKTDVTTYLTILNTALAGRHYLLKEYCLADTHLYVFIGWIDAMGIDMAQFANITAWRARCSKRPKLAQLES